MYNENNKGSRTVPYGTKLGPNPILLAVVCSTEKNLSISVSSPNCLLLRSSCGGVSNAFSKSKMNVSTCPPLSNILAQSFINVVNWVSQLCLFLNACCLSERSNSLYSSWWAMMFKHTMCSSNLEGTRQWDGTIITCKSPVTLFIEGTYICKRQFFGDFTCVKRLLEEMSKNWTQFSCKLL